MLRFGLFGAKAMLSVARYGPGGQRGTGPLDPRTSSRGGIS
jgi:hypothetical protein